MDARSVVSDQDDDRRSVASTTATTASLASRIQSLAVDFGPKSGHEGAGIAEEEGEEEEEVVEIPEEQLLQELDRQEPAFKVCCRLFRSLGPGQAFKRLSLEQAESFQSKGYLVVDGFLAADHALRIRTETLAFVRQGRLQEACSIGRDGSAALQDRTARGDAILWLHPGASAAASPSFTALLAAFKELQEDLAQVMRLRLRGAELQLAHYPASGAQYVRHRDAFPDDAPDGGERKVTAIVYANPGWRREDGGKLRLWPPMPAAVAAAAVLANGHSSLSNGSASSGPAPADASPHAAEVGPHEHAGLPANGHASELGLGAPCDGGSGLGPRSPKSMSSSVAAEPTEASSAADNASADGGSVKSSSRRSEATVANGRRAAAEEPGAAAVVDVAPLAGRLVLFLSGAVEHAVLPSFADRVAVTMWCQ